LSEYWIPTPLEQKCLRHLDEPENWTILRRERPDSREVLPWAPFRRIFAINFVQYASILALIFVGLESASASTIGEVIADLPYAVPVVVLIASVLSLWVTHLYRRSWNRRARSLRRA
jgi:hypothetical protein